jgi:zinc protease
MIDYSKGIVRPILAITLILLVFTGCSSFSPSSVPSSQAEREGSLLPFDSEVSRGTLENGLTYYLRENNRPENRIVLRLVVDAGSVLEREDERGVAHFVEHMAFNGTKDFPGQQIVEFLESVGMQFGPEINAFTSFDETVYMLNLPADDPELLEKGLHVLSEWAFGIVFDPQEVEKERGVIIEEWRLGRGASGRLRDHYFPVLLEGSLYAERLPVGVPEIIRNVSPRELESFYRRWYQPQSMALIVSGPVDKERVVSLIEERFSTPGATKTADRPDLGIPDGKTARAIVAVDSEASRASVSIYHHNPLLPLITEKDYRKHLVVRLYGSMLNRRLELLTRKSDPPFINAGAGLTSITRNSSSYVLAASVDDKEVEKGIRALLSELRRVQQHGFTKEEFERAVERLLSSYRQGWEERNTTDSFRYAQELTSHFLSAEAVPGIDFEYEFAKQTLPEITPSEIESLSAQLIHQRAPVIVVTGPGSDPAAYPDESKLLSIYEEITGSDMEPYREESGRRVLMDAIPEKGSIVNRSPVLISGERLGETLHLSNGSRLWLKRTDFRSNQILFFAATPGGVSLAEDDRYVSALLSAALSAQGGLGDLSLTALQNVLSGKNVQLSPLMENYYFILQGSSGSEELETLLQLAYLYSTAPRYDEEASTAYLQRLSTALQNRELDPEVRFRDAVMKMMWDDHLRSRPLNSKVAREEADPEKAFRFYTEVPKAGPASDLIMIGNIPEDDELFPLVERYLASIPSVQESSWIDRGMSLSPESEDLLMKEAVGDQARVELHFSGNFEPGKQFRTKMDLMRELYNIRLREELREEEGGTYGVGVGVSLIYRPEPQYLFSISFGASPERSQDLADQAMEIVNRYRSEEFSGPVMERGKQILTASLDERSRQNSFWLSRFAAAARGEAALEPLEAEKRRIMETEASAIRDFAAELIDPGTVKRAVLLPRE